MLTVDKLAQVSICLVALLALCGCNDPKAEVAARKQAADQAVAWERHRVSRILTDAERKRVSAGDGRSAALIAGLLSQVEAGK